MLFIRNEQKEVFKNAAVAQSAADLTETLCKRYPVHCTAAGKPALKSLVDAGIARCMALGLEKRGEVQTYVELSLLLGHGFENDSQLPWAADILGGPDDITMVQKLEQVYAEAIVFLNQVAGPNGVRMDQALQAIANAPGKELIPPPSPDFKNQLMQALKRLFPGKALVLGDANLAFLVRNGLAKADALKMVTPLGQGMCVWLVYLLGIGFADDPMFPWVGQVLASEAPSDHRDQRLAHEARAYLDRWLQALENQGV